MVGSAKSIASIKFDTFLRSFAQRTNSEEMPLTYKPARRLQRQKLPCALVTTHKQSKQMKARAERITGEAVKAAIAAMANLRKDLKPIIQDMEATHEMDELAQNLNYCAPS